MKPWTTVSLGLLTLALWTVPASAERRPHGPPPDREERGYGERGIPRGPDEEGHPPPIAGRIARELGLFPEQTDALMESFEEAVLPKIREIRKTQRHLMGLALLDPESPKIKEIQSELLAKQKELMAAQLDLGRKLRGTLTPDQLERLGGLIERLEQRFSEEGPEEP